MAPSVLEPSQASIKPRGSEPIAFRNCLPV
jgi:hypothetical protein